MAAKFKPLVFYRIPESRYVTSAPTAQKTQLYCSARNIVLWTSHVTPSQYFWYVTSCACVEVCLPGPSLETDCVTPLFHCWYVYYLETALWLSISCMG
jgi:hypothetical protein